jgi:chromosome segregation ATPase
MDTPLRVLQERTNRLNQQFNENEENINRRFSKGLLQELQETNDSITINTETLIKDLESQLEENTKAQRGKDETIGRLKEDIEILLEMNKSQANEIEGLRVRVNEAEAEASAKREQAELWHQEQQDLRSEKADMREEIVRTMEKLSQQKVHAESMEIEYKKQIVELEEKLMSSVHMSEEKGYLIDELIDKYNELKVRNYSCFIVDI